MGDLRGLAGLWPLKCRSGLRLNNVSNYYLLLLSCGWGCGGTCSAACRTGGGTCGGGTCGGAGPGLDGVGPVDETDRKRSAHCNICHVRDDGISRVMQTLFFTSGT